MRRTPTLYEEALQNVYITEEEKQELATKGRELRTSKEGDAGKSEKEDKGSTSKQEDMTSTSTTSAKILLGLEVPIVFSRCAHKHFALPMRADVGD
jgi:hypothetical protein